MRTGCIGEILDIEFEFRLLYLKTAEIVHVLHHEVPHWQIRRRCGAFEHLKIKTLVSGAYVARKLAHLIYLSIIGIFISHGQNFVGIECRADRDVAKSRVKRVFARRQQSRTLHFLVVASACYAIGLEWFEGLRDLIYVSGSGIFCLDYLQKVVRRVRRHRYGSIRSPVVGSEHPVFAQIHKCHKIAGLVVFSGLVCYPHLYTCDFHARRYKRQT